MRPETLPPLVGLIGRKRSGKDTLADVLVGKYGFAKGGFADPLREAALATNPIVAYERPSLYVVAEVRYREALNRYGYEGAKDRYPEVRTFLQRLGTDGIRALDDGFWVRIAEQRMDARTGPLVLTDVRFPNEAEAITKRGGYLIRVVRPGQPDDDDVHPSETALDDWPVNTRLENDGTLEEFVTKVSAVGRYLRFISPTR
jgi:hypothetical protein